MLILCIQRAGHLLPPWKNVPISMGMGIWMVLKALEQELLGQNKKHMDWTCTEDLMSTTRNGSALYMHCLPADISGVSCEHGEVEASVFDRYRVPQYKQASYKPYIIAAMIFLSKQKNSADVLQRLLERATPRAF